jgi:hypothetical protein
MACSETGLLLQRSSGKVTLELELMFLGSKLLISYLYLDIYAYTSRHRGTLELAARDILMSSSGLNDGLNVMFHNPELPMRY